VIVWIYNYLCNQCLSPLKLWVQIQLRRGVLDTTLCDNCQWLARGRWFSQVSSTNTVLKMYYTMYILVCRGSYKYKILMKYFSVKKGNNSFKESNCHNIWIFKRFGAISKLLRIDCLKLQLLHYELFIMYSWLQDAVTLLIYVFLVTGCSNTPDICIPGYRMQ
jgi:hypothetical protein